MIDRRNLRSLVTFAGIAVPGVLIATTGFLAPLAGGSVERGADQIRLPASDTVSVCPGPWQTAEEAAGTDAEFSTDPAPPATVQAATAPISAPDGTRRAAGLSSASLDGAENFTVGASPGFVSGDDRAEAPVRVTGLAEDESPALVSAGQTVAAPDGDYAGLAVLSCVRPTTRAVFTAASGGPGSDARLLIGNPSQAPITVRIDLVGAHGPVTAAGEDTIGLQPGEQRAVLLGALAPDEPVLGIELSAADGLMTSVLQQIERDGLTSLGIEYGAPTAPAATEAEVPLAAAGSAALRVVNPGDTATTVRIEHLGHDGPVDIAESSAAIPARGVVEVPLGDVPAGVVRVTGEDPVHAGARLTADGDFAEVPAVEPLRAGQLLVLPRGPETSVVLGAADGTLTVSGLREDGTSTEARTVDLSPDRTSVITPDALFGEDVMALHIDTPDGTAVRGAAMASGEAGIGALVVPSAPSGIGYRDIRIGS